MEQNNLSKEEMSKITSPLDKIYMEDCDPLSIERMNRANRELEGKKDVLLIILDTDKRNREEIILRKELGIDFIDELETKHTKFGLKIYVDFDKQPEDLVRIYYEFKGYNVIKCHHRNLRIYNEKEKQKVLNYLLEKYNLHNDTEIIKRGIPDFLIYKEEEETIKELFFVEVKGKLDSLKIEQMDWIFSNNIPVKIVCVIN